MNKKQLSEQEIRTRYITPALQEAGWSLRQMVIEAKDNNHPVGGGMQQALDIPFVYSSNGDALQLAPAVLAGVVSVQSNKQVS